MHTSPRPALPKSYLRSLLYRWGSESPLKRIELDNELCSVRESLDFALQHLWYRRNASVLWGRMLFLLIKPDEEENGHQVFRMGNILYWL